MKHFANKQKNLEKLNFLENIYISKIDHIKDRKL